MTVEEAKEYAKGMTFSDAVYNAMQGRAVPFKKATKIKLKELLEIAKRADEDTQIKDRFDRKGAGMTDQECCGTCKWHRTAKCYQSQRDSSGDGWRCANPDSEYYLDWTEYGDRCEEWEERD